MAPNVAGEAMSAWRMDAASANAEKIAERVVTSGYAEVIGERAKPPGSTGSWEAVWDRMEVVQPSLAARCRRLSRLRSMSQAAKWAYGSPTATPTSP